VVFCIFQAWFFGEKAGAARLRDLKAMTEKRSPLPRAYQWAEKTACPMHQRGFQAYRPVFLEGCSFIPWENDTACKPDFLFIVNQTQPESKGKREDFTPENDLLHERARLFRRRGVL